MPHFLGEILVATKEELVPLWFSNSKSLSSKLSQFKDKPYGPKRALIGGNGRKLLVVFDTLPKKIQDALGDPRQPEHPLDKHYKIDPAATRFYTTYLFDDGEPLTMDAQDKHITSASILEAVKKLEIDRRTERKNKGGSLRDVNKTLWQDAMSFIKLQEKREGESFQHNLNKKYRYFMDQFKNFKKESFKGIIKNYKSNTNAKKVRKLEEKLLNDLFATQQDKPHATKVARQYEAFLNGYLEIVNNKTGEVYDPKDFNPVAQSTIALYLNKWENKIGTYAARSGDRQKLMSQFSPYHSFERPKFAGSILSIDDRQPPFEYEKGKRMWFYIGIDLASEAITCWVHGKTKEDLIINFYRELVRNYHAWGYSLPLELECESSLNSSFKNTFLRNGAMFQEVRIEANKARAKKIERYFGKLRYEVEKEHEGWIARPFARSESNQAGSTSKKIIPFPQLANDRIQDLVDWNNSAHSVDNSISRWDYFTANQNPDLKPTNYKAILPYMGKRTETSCNVGIIKLQRSEFLLGDAGKIATGEKLLNLMTKTEGRNIEVFWLDDHEGKVFKALVYINGQYICEAITKPKPNKSSHERRAAGEENGFEIMAAYNRTIDSFQKLRKNELEPVTIINRKPKTLNNNFQIPGLNKQKTPASQEAEVLKDHQEAEDFLNYEPQEYQGGSWRSNFNN